MTRYPVTQHVRGKTECMLRYRGRNASKKLDARRIGKDDALGVKVPDVQGAIINVVDVYKHLGCQINADGSDFDEAQTRYQSAMTAYSPLAIRIFGA